MSDFASDEPLTSISGVGPKVAEKLAGLGLETCADALFHLPLRYEDRTRVVPIGLVRVGQSAVVCGDVISAGSFGRSRKALVATLDDGSGRITLRFFHFYHRQQQAFKAKPRLVCFGEVRAGFDGLEMVHPQYQAIGLDAPVPVEDALTPVYPAAEGVSQNLLRKIVAAALENANAEELCPTPFDYDLIDALRYVHLPPPDADQLALLGGVHPAQQRLAFEELVAHRLTMRLLRDQIRRRAAPPLALNSSLVADLINSLAFQLTAAQTRCHDEIANDLGRSRPMLRLLHGDVGSGKTVVAALAAAACMAAGLQVAIVAPTEILAEQHRASFAQWFEPFAITPQWLSSRVKGKARSATLSAIADGAPLSIGTHALMEPTVDFSRLGLVIVDEQHRFGVRQRLKLRDKGAGDESPHQLIMTATPIPRTLAMTSYADLDVSVIDELPPGRTPVTTVVIGDQRRHEVIARVAAAAADGRQVYWVCTLIDESETLQAETATGTAQRLAEDLAGLEVGLIHGRLKADEKESVMAGFKANRIQVLVATTVIEVGVDVPNASLMIIENAERLGLSQLHQLRGRVGRGSAVSSCVLMYRGPLSETARARLKVMRETANGFEIAARDLELRGPGEVLGVRQTGAAQFRVADLGRDRHMLDEVATTADELTSQSPHQVDRLIRRWVGDAARFGAV